MLENACIAQKRAEDILFIQKGLSLPLYHLKLVWFDPEFVYRQRMLQSLVGIRRILSAIESMVWSLRYLNYLIQRRRHSIATTLPLVTITLTWSWFSRCLCWFK